jgi:DNA repair protein RadD
MNPYRHQHEDLKRLHEATTGESWRVLYVAFMGSGKTHVATKLIRRWVQARLPVLILVHKREILEQTWSKLLENDLREEQIGVVWQRDRRAKPNAPIQLASILTLARRRPPKGIRIIVVDEAHHIPAASWQKVIGWYPGIPILGLTGTPERLDGEPLEGSFNTMVESSPVQTLIENGCIDKPEVWTREDHWLPDMRGMAKVGGDWKNKDAAAAMNRSKIIGELPMYWEKHAHGMPTVGFAATVKQATKLVDTFNASGITSELLTSSKLDGTKTLEAQRKQVLERLRNGTTKVLWTCDILGEGWNFPAARCAILARPTASIARYLQWCGRVMRAGHQTPIILDHAGNYYIHGLPWEEQGWSLTGRRPKKKTIARATEGGRVVLLEPIEVNGELVRADEKPRQRVCVGWADSKTVHPCPTKAKPGLLALRSKLVLGQWRCRPCSRKHWAASLTPEERKARTLPAIQGAKKKWSKMSPAERAAEIQDRLNLPKGGQSERSKTMWETSRSHQRVSPKVLELLKRKPKGLTLSEIAEALPEHGYSQLGTIVDALYRSGTITFRETVLVRGKPTRKYILSKAGRS